MRISSDRELMPNFWKMLAMVVDRSRTDEQLRGNYPGRDPLPHRAHDRQLLSRQLLE
jgi:hypothetical protein